MLTSQLFTQGDDSIVRLERAIASYFPPGLLFLCFGAWMADASFRTLERRWLHDVTLTLLWIVFASLTQRMGRIAHRAEAHSSVLLLLSALLSHATALLQAVVALHRSPVADPSRPGLEAAVAMEACFVGPCLALLGFVGSGLATRQRLSDPLTVSLLEELRKEQDQRDEEAAIRTGTLIRLTFTSHSSLPDPDFSPMVYSPRTCRP